MECLVAAIEKVSSFASQFDANLEEMKTEMRTNEERMEPSYNVSTCYLCCLSKDYRIHSFRKWTVGFTSTCAPRHNLA
jgi:hypothetical protein